MKTIVTVMLAVTAGGCFLPQYLPLLPKAKDGDAAIDEPCSKVLIASPTGEVCMAVFQRTARTDVPLPDTLQNALAFYALSDDRHSDTEISSSAVAADYARALDVKPDEVDAAMKQAGVAATVAVVFDRHLRAFGATVMTHAEAQSPAWRKVYVEPVLAARAAWDAGAARRAPWLAKAKALGAREDAVGVSGKKDPTLLGDLVALQRAYIADCRKAGVAVEDCLGDEVARPVTRRIVRLAWASGDKQLAAAENALFDVPDASDRAFLVRRAVKAAVVAAAADRKAWEQAKSEGRGADAMRARWPDEPIEVDDDDDGLPGAVPGAHDDDVIKDDSDEYWPSKSIAAVASVARKGDRAVIAFKRDVETTTETAECHETNRVDSIDSDGNLHYREECSGTVHETVDLTEKPITVPAAEAAAIHAGEIVTFVADDHRRAHVVEVHAADPEAPGATLAHDYEFTSARTQLGEYRLPAARPSAKAARKPR